MSGLPTISDLEGMAIMGGIGLAIYLYITFEPPASPFQEETEQVITDIIDTTKNTIANLGLIGEETERNIAESPGTSTSYKLKKEAEQSIVDADIRRTFGENRFVAEGEGKYEEGLANIQSGENVAGGVGGVLLGGTEYVGGAVGSVFVSTGHVIEAGGQYTAAGTGRAVVAINSVWDATFKPKTERKHKKKCVKRGFLGICTKRE